MILRPNTPKNSEVVIGGGGDKTWPNINRGLYELLTWLKFG